MRYPNGTCLQSEEYAYPAGGQTRRGRAVFPDGRIRRVWGGIPDTLYTIPAHARVCGRYVAGTLMVQTASGLSTATDDDPAFLAFYPRSNGRAAS